MPCSSDDYIVATDRHRASEMIEGAWFSRCQPLLYRPLPFAVPEHPGCPLEIIHPLSSNDRDIPIGRYRVLTSDDVISFFPRGSLRASGLYYDGGHDYQDDNSQRFLSDHNDYPPLRSTQRKRIHVLPIENDFGNQRIEMRSDKRHPHPCHFNRRRLSLQ